MLLLAHGCLRQGIGLIPDTIWLRPEVFIIIIRMFLTWRHRSRSNLIRLMNSVKWISNITSIFLQTVITMRKCPKCREDSVIHAIIIHKHNSKIWTALAFRTVISQGCVCGSFACACEYACACASARAFVCMCVLPWT